MKVSLARTSSQSKQIEAFRYERARFLTLKVGLRNLFATIPHHQIKFLAPVPVRQTTAFGSNLSHGCVGVIWAVVVKG